MATLAELEAHLTEVQICINKILGSNTQEHWIGGSDRHRSPELSRLFEERRRLRSEIEEVSGSAVVMSRIAIIE